MGTRAALTAAERETIITYDETPDMAIVSTYDHAIISALLDRGLLATDVAREHGQIVGATFRVPKRWIKVKPPRVVTDAQREQGRRLAQLRRKAKEDEE